jgi:hypothetical protein
MISSTLALVVLSAGYSFTVDGRPVQPPLTLLNGGAAVVVIEDLALWLDEPRDYAFTVDRDGDARAVVIKEGATPVGLVVGPPRHADQPPPKVPTLSPAQMKCLRGLSLDSSRRRPDLRALTPSRLCLTLTNPGLHELGSSLGSLRSILGDPDAPRDIESALAGSGQAEPASVNEPAKPIEVENPGPLPPFPGLVCLALLDKVKTASEMPSLPTLRYLGGNTADVHGAWLAPAKKLEVIKVNRALIDGPAALGALPALRVLEAENSYAEAFEGAFPALERLVLHGPGFGPLAKLRAPKLTTLVLEAEQTPSLPASLPALAEASVWAPLVPSDAVDRFVKAHPRATVQRGWAARLRLQVAKADRVVLRSGGLCHRQPNHEKVLVDRRSAEDVAALLATIDIDEKSSKGFCMCCGNPTLEFYRGERLLESVGLQHGHALRWTWPADARLATDATMRKLEAWGATGLLEERQRTLDATKGQ